MPNFPARRVYPNENNVAMSPARDAGDVTKESPTGIARGSATPDYNVKLRGLGQRIDKKPKRPYP